MSKHTFKAGDMVYSAYGAIGKYVAHIEDGHIVQPALEDYDGEQYFSGADVWRDVFPTLPVVKLHEEVAALEKQAEDLRTNIRTLRQSQIDLERDTKARMAAITSHEQLKHLEDFIAGRVTHYVEDDYGAIKIVPFADARCQSEKRELKLLTLFGTSKGNLSWKLNKYNDGSGSSIEVQPCTSEEQALEIAGQWIEQKYAEWRSDPAKVYRLSNAVQSARKMGLAIPDDVHAAERAYAVKKIDDRLAEIRKQEAAALADLAKAKGEA